MLTEAVSYAPEAPPLGPVLVPAIALPDEVAAYRDVLAAFVDISAVRAAGATLDETLQTIASKACELLGVSRSIVYLRDDETGLFHGRAAHGRRDITGLVQQMVAGGSADALTNEIVATRAPIVVRDARTDPRPLRATMRTFGVRSLLGVPMVAQDEVVGLIFADDDGDPHVFTSADQEPAASFGGLAGIAVREAQLTEELRKNMSRSARQAELLRRSMAVEKRLTRLVFEGAGLSEVAAAVAELTAKPVAIHDASARRLAMGLPPGMAQETAERLLDERRCASSLVRDAFAEAEEGRATTVGPLPAADLQHRLLLATVTAADRERWGYIVVVEFGERFSALDPVIAMRAATIVAVELTAAQRVRAAELDARESLVAHLLSGARDAGTLAARADFLGFRVRSPHVVCLFGAADQGGAPTPVDLVAAIESAAPDAEALAAEVAEGTAVVLELPAGLPVPEAVAHAKGVAAAALERLGGGGGVRVAVSGVCREPTDYPAAYGEVRQTLRCLESFNSDCAVIACDDLGIGRLLLSAVDRSDAERFARDTLGELLAPDDWMADLLLTLRCFFKCSRSIRRSAERLDVHENTIRHRLRCVDRITGLPVSHDADAQMRVQLALLVCELGRRLPANGAPLTRVEAQSA